MLDATIKSQLQTYLGKVKSPVEITASLDQSEKSVEMRAMLQEIASMSDLLTLTERSDDGRRRCAR